MRLQSKDPIRRVSNEAIFVFDMDGTLIDTDYANFLSYRQAIKSITGLDYGLLYNPKERFNRSSLEKLIPNLTEADYKRIITKKELCYKEFLPETNLNTEVVDILLKYSQTNKTILVTNSHRERAEMTLNYHSLKSKFDYLFYCTGDKKINKFQNAILKLKLQPDSLILFEDEKEEIINAQQAGIKIINPKII